MKILVDIDGVIFNTQEELLKWLNEENETNYTLTDITSYDWFNNTFENPFAPMRYEAFWRGTKINKDAVKCILKWKSEGHTIKFVTASSYYQSLLFKVRKMLNYFNSEFDDKDVIVCHDKSMVSGFILIDDCFDNCDNFHSYSIVYKQPWNKEAKSKKEFVNSGIVLRTNEWRLIDGVIQLFVPGASGFFNFYKK